MAIAPPPPTSAMPPPPAAAPARPGSRGSRGTEIQASLHILRQLRAEISDLRDLLRRVRDGKEALTASAAYIENAKTKVNLIFARLGSNPVAASVADGDESRHFENLWGELLGQSIIAHPKATISPDDQTVQLALCDELCRALVARLGEKTIPARLNDWLEDAWVGYLLPFHDLFSDEMPEGEDRQRLLRFLSAAPGLVVGGIIDPATGLVYPYHAKKWARRLVCGALAAAFVIVTAGVALAGRIAALNAYIQRDAEPLVVGWLLLTAGVLTHMAVDRSKRGNGLGSIPLGHLAAAIDARSGVILLKMLLMLFAYFGLLFLGEKGQTGHHLSAFLVGYSLDSFVGIFSSALDKRATRLGESMTKGEE